MKTKYLIYTAIISIVLTFGVNYLIVKWNFRSFNESAIGDKFRKACGEAEYKSWLLLQNPPSNYSLKEMNRLKSELHSYGNKCFEEWFEENKAVIYLKFLIPIFAFFIFNISILNFKYSNNYKTIAMIKEGLKNPFYSIIVILYFTSLLINLFFSKSGMLFISELP